MVWRCPGAILHGQRLFYQRLIEDTGKDVVFRTQIPTRFATKIRQTAVKNERTRLGTSSRSAACTPKNSNVSQSNRPSRANRLLLVSCRAAPRVVYVAVRTAQCVYGCVCSSCDFTHILTRWRARTGTGNRCVAVNSRHTHTHTPSHH